jgi:hypothetical protein
VVVVVVVVVVVAAAADAGPCDRYSYQNTYGKNCNKKLN